MISLPHINTALKAISNSNGNNTYTGFVWFSCEFHGWVVIEENFTIVVTQIGGVQ